MLNTRKKKEAPLLNMHQIGTVSLPAFMVDEMVCFAWCLLESKCGTRCCGPFGTRDTKMALKFRKFMQARAAMKTGKVVVGHRRQAETWPGKNICGFWRPISAIAIPNKGPIFPL